MTAIKTEPIDISVENEEKFVVDKKLLQKLIKSAQKVKSFHEVQRRYKFVIDTATDGDDLVLLLEEEIFFQKVINHKNFPTYEK